MEKLLDVKDLKISFQTYAGKVQAVRGVSFFVNKKEVLGIVGESGCGKSVTSSAIMRILPQPPALYEGGEARLLDVNLLSLKEEEMRLIRGRDISMIFQDAMASLNPTIKIGKQIMEPLMIHQSLKANAAREKAIEMLDLVGISNPEKRVDQYPHEFSGGMRQRAMIAIALACRPKLLIADEPTTALDVTIQAQIIKLMNNLKEEMGTSIIMITHDLGVVAEMCDRIVVMYAGKIIESGNAKAIFYNPKHPYTTSLLESVPNMKMSRDKVLTPIPGTPPDLFAPPVGCSFYARCKHAMNICKDNEPAVTDVPDEYDRLHYSACWLNSLEYKEYNKEAVR
ncbi:MAG: ABC transporter ATP-binding protein [Clostridiales bacterium]|jgi:oligopeptide transport system ATP-binding protein|nr:ABC transporter ATP-binding protein [Clostridiales bacterium]